MTIKDIAKISGYSVSTVSRALNDHIDVNKETKDKIKKIAKENSFVPNSNARQLKQQISNSIVILVKGRFNMFLATIVEQMQNEISKSKYSVVIHYIDENENEINIAEQICAERKPQGIIFLGGNIETFKKDFSRISVPCVLSTTSAQSLNFKNLSSVSVDDVKGAKIAVDYLLDNGHKNILVIGGECEQNNTSGLRLLGCKKSFENHNIIFDDTCFCESHYSISEAYEKAKASIIKNKKITAIFAMSDIMAFGAISAISDLGLSVPNDISVIGFDGIEFANYYCPKLTTLRQPNEKIASKSVKLLLRLIHGEKPTHHDLLDVEFIKGASVSKLI